LVDLASDRRAATPSQAAELATPDRDALWSELARATEQLNRHMDWRLHGLETTLNLLADQGLARLDPIKSHRRYLAHLALRLERAAPSRRLDKANMRLSMLRQRLQQIGFGAARTEGSAKVNEFIGRLNLAIGHAFEKRTHNLELAIAHLKGLHPESPLDRGFVLVCDHERRRMTSSLGIKVGAKLRLRWKDGEKRVTVE